MCEGRKRENQSRVSALKITRQSMIYCRSGNVHVKNNAVKNFRGVKFSQFCSVHEILLTVDGYNMDERLKHS